MKIKEKDYDLSAYVKKLKADYMKDYDDGDESIYDNEGWYQATKDGGIYDKLMKKQNMNAKYGSQLEKYVSSSAAKLRERVIFDVSEDGAIAIQVGKNEFGNPMQSNMSDRDAIAAFFDTLFKFKLDKGIEVFNDMIVTEITDAVADILTRHGVDFKNEHTISED